MSKALAATTLIAGGILVFGLAAPAMAQTTSKEASAKAEPAPSVKTPGTAQEHLMMAETYRKKAATYRADAATHRQMLETYKKQVAVPTDQKVPIENPWIKKMRVHCESYVRSAESLAADAEAFAEFHTLRAHETQGK